MRNPLDPFSKVVDGQAHWDPEWYSWLTDATAATTKLEATVAAQQAAITVQQSTITALQATVAALPPSGLVFLQRQVVTTPVSSVDFIGLSTTYPYDKFLFEGAALTCSLNDAAIFMRASNNNGVSFDAGNSYNYEIIYHHGSLGGGNTVIGSVASGQTFVQVTHGQTFGSNTGTGPYTLSFSLRTHNAGAAHANQHPLFMSTSLNWHGVNGMMQLHSAGMWITGGFNAVRFLSHIGGTITSGSITMYGFRQV